MSIVICNVCGTSFDIGDDCVCPQCGALTYMPEIDEYRNFSEEEYEEE